MVFLALYMKNDHTYNFGRQPLSKLHVNSDCQVVLFRAINLQNPPGIGIVLPIILDGPAQRRPRHWRRIRTNESYVEN